MTHFEELLIKTGNPELIGSYINEYRTQMSEGFERAARDYIRDAEKVIDYALRDIPLEASVSIKEFVLILPFSYRTRFVHFCKAYDFETLGDLIGCSEDELLKLPKFGRHMLTALKRGLAEFNLKLKE